MKPESVTFTVLQVLKPIKGYIKKGTTVSLNGRNYDASSLKQMVKCLKGEEWAAYFEGTDLVLKWKTGHAKLLMQN